MPGRERLARTARSRARARLLRGWPRSACARLASWPGAVALEPTWLERDARLLARLRRCRPSLPAFLLARFSARAAPRSAALVLLIGGVASLALLSAPGIVGCEYTDELHHTLSHALIPLVGAAVLWVAMLPVYLSARRSSEA